MAFQTVLCLLLTFAVVVNAFHAPRVPRIASRRLDLHGMPGEIFGKLYDSKMHLEAWQTPEIESYARMYCKEAFDIKVLDENVKSLTDRHAPQIFETYRDYKSSELYTKLVFGYKHDGRKHFSTLTTHLLYADDGVAPEFNINLRMSDNCFLYSDPDQVGKVIHKVDSVRHRCTGWCLMDNSIFQQMPSLLQLGTLLLGEGKVVQRECYYNREHEMLETTQRDKEGTTIRLIFERLEHNEYDDEFDEEYDDE